MAINVAGTNALGDYFVSEILNIRTLMGDSPQASSLPLIPAPAASTPATPGSPARTNLQAQVLAQNVANTQTLFGIQSANDGSAIDSLPPIPGETPQQIASVALQSSNIASEFSNIATLFGSLGLGTTTNTVA
jgi:hypothetical protein